MRRAHFTAFAPICPACLVVRGEEVPVAIAFEDVADQTTVTEGALRCASPECAREYPILDGIPLLVPDPREYVAQSIAALHARDDLGERIEAMLGEGCGPGSAFDVTRCHISSYAWDHWADLDPNEAVADPPPGSAVRVLERALALAQAPLAAPAVELGCATGRVTFELAARTGGLALGLDLNFALLRVAMRVLRDGVVRYARRKHGLLFERRAFAVSHGARDRVDFWVADARALPLRTASLGAAVSLNLLDANASPLDVLRQLARTLRPGGRTALAAPWDWSGAVTAPEAWIGGHSPRGHFGGDSAAVLRALLTPGAHPASVAGLALEAEDSHVPWRVRVHERSSVDYDAQVAVAVRTRDAPA